MPTSASDATSRPGLVLLLMREVMGLACGNELSMGLLLAWWLLAGALGSPVGRAWVHGADPARTATRAAWLCLLPAPLLMGALAVVRAAPLLMAHLADLALAYGYVCHMVGAIIGAFMVGVAAGSLGVHRPLKTGDERGAGRALTVVPGVMALMALAVGGGLPTLARAELGLAAPWLFPLVTALIGVTVGAVFPLATAAAGGDGASTPAGLYAVDLAGAAVGAAVVGAFLAPAPRLPGACLLGALIAGGTALLTGVRAAFTT